MPNIHTKSSETKEHETTSLKVPMKPPLASDDPHNIIESAKWPNAAFSDEFEKCEGSFSSKYDLDEEKPQPHTSDSSNEVTPEILILPKWRAVVITFAITAVTFTCSMSTGLITIGIPQIAVDLRLPNHLILWSVTVSP